MSESVSGWSEHRFIAFDKTPIFYRHLHSSALKRATILILHGMGEHGGRYRELCEFLSAKGVECYLPDLRGFGQSGGKRACLRHFSDYFKDLDVIYRLARISKNPTPFFTLGHSYGGLIVSSWQAASSERHFQGLILSSPNFGIAVHVPIWRHALAMAVSHVFPDYTQDNRVERDKLTHDKGIMQAYVKDPLNFRGISAGLYREMMVQLSQVDEIAAKIDSPALVLQAGEDRVVSRAATERFYQKLASKDKTFQVYEGLYHEILNEAERPAIFTRISDWILTHCNTSP